MLDHAPSVSNLLGLDPKVNTLESLDALVSKGIPVFCVDSLAQAIFGDHDEAQRFKQQLLSETNNPNIRAVLTPAASAKLERLARTFALANYVFDDLNDARAFFTNQHRALNGRSPLDVSTTELGAIRVAQLMYQLYFGVLPHIPK